MKWKKIVKKCDVVLIANFCLIIHLQKYFFLASRVTYWNGFRSHQCILGPRCLPYWIHKCSLPWKWSVLSSWYYFKSNIFGNVCSYQSMHINACWEKGTYYHLDIISSLICLVMCAQINRAHKCLLGKRHVLSSWYYFKSNMKGTPRHIFQKVVKSP